MGYSLSINARNKKLQTTMLEFFEKEYRPYWKALGFEEEYNCYTSPPVADNDISYTRSNKGKHLIGINFNAFGIERFYAFTLIRWMALKIGRVRRKFSEPDIRFEDPMPYMVYDVEDPWPVIDAPLSSVPTVARWCCVDKYGMKRDIRSYTSILLDVIDVDVFNSSYRQAALKHGIDINNWPSPKNEPYGVRHEIKDTQMRLLAPEIKKAIRPLKNEMKRLDKAWEKIRI